MNDVELIDFITRLGGLVELLKGKHADETTDDQETLSYESSIIDQAMTLRYTLICLLGKRALMKNGRLP